MLIKALNLNKSVKGPDGKFVNILKNINLEVFSGDFLTIIGPSGSGKTTLLQILGLMDIPDSGEVIFLGQNYNSLSRNQKAITRSRNIGFMFQKSLLINDLTIEENLILSLKIANKKYCNKDVDYLLKEVGLIDKKCLYPRMLSSGEAQRAALARAVINKPDVVFADEPIANLDKDNKVIILDLLKCINSKKNTTIVLASHDDLVLQYSNRSLKLIDGQILCNFNTLDL